MKFYLNFFKRQTNKPTFKFFLNLFFLKINQYFLLKQLNFIHIYLNVQKVFKIKLFKLNYSVYNTLLLGFFILNLLIQLYLVIIYIC